MIGFQVEASFWLLGGGTPQLLGGVPQLLGARHAAHWGDALRAAHGAEWGDLQPHTAGHATGWGDLQPHTAAHQAAWTLLTTHVVTHQADWAINTTNPRTVRHLAAWSMPIAAHLRAVENTPTLSHAGRHIGMLGASLSCDEGSAVWLAQIEIAQLGDFARISIGDAITLTLGLEVFALVIDGKTLSRDDMASQRCSLSAVSPLALLDAPFTGEISRYEHGTISARTAVESIIGSVTWNLPDWIIPAGRLQIENATPLAAARAIVQAIGGLIESNSDGSVICRARHPVSIPHYPITAVNASLFDSDVLSVGTQIAPHRGFNRITLSNEEGSGSASSDAVEYDASADDDNRGTVRAYLGTDRPVTLVHTGNPGTVIASAGRVTRSETETLEFIEGQATTRYPITAVTSAVWQHVNLGSLTASGKTLLATVAGYSLLQLTYTTTALEWQVALGADEEVQFVLIDS